MSTAALALQRALYARLTGDADLMAQIKGVADEPAERLAFPWVQLGDVVETPDDAHDRSGVTAVVTLHIWSTYRGWSQALTILGHLDRILHRRPLDVEDWRCVSIVREWHSTTRDPDPQIRHMPVRFRVRLEQE